MIKTLSKAQKMEREKFRIDILPVPTDEAARQLQGKVDVHCHADSQHRADELPGIQHEKDVFVVVADFFRYFDFYKAPPLYNPIISFTMRSQPFIAPTSTSRLKANSPT